MTCRHRGAGQELPQPRLWGRPRRAHGITPALERRLGNGPQEHGGKAPRNLAQPPTAHHGKGQDTGGDLAHGPRVEPPCMSGVKDTR